MNVVELSHPEDLLDKLEAGLIAPAERQRLDVHLAGCATCRMELAMRSDFAAEPPLALPELPQLTLDAAPEPERAPVSVAPRPGRRRQFSLLMVAAAWCASSALAATAAVSSAKVPWAAWFGRANTSAAASVKAPVHHVRSTKSVTAPSAAPAASETAAVASNSAEATDGAAPESAPSALAASRAPNGHAEGAKARGAKTSDAANAVAGTAAFPLSAANPAAAMLAEADHARRAGDAGHAIALYRELEQTYPSSPESGLSVALLAKLLLDRGDASGAVTAYDRYLRSGSSSLRAESLVGRARALERLGRTGDALAAWQEVERSLPGTVHARLAAERLAALSDR